MSGMVPVRTRIGPGEVASRHAVGPLVVQDLRHRDVRPNGPPGPALRRAGIAWLKKPPLSATSMPGFSRGDLVMTLTTPVRRWRPHGCRTTHDFNLLHVVPVRRQEVHSTMPKKSRYSERPSTSTSSELASVWVA